MGQLIKRKLLLLSADGESKRDWFGLVGAADQSASSGSHFKLRRLDECVWWRVCHSKGCRIKSQSDFPWEGLKKNHWRQERKGGAYKIVRQRPATTYERHKKCPDFSKNEGVSNKVLYHAALL